MIFHETPLSGAYVIEPEPVGDERGLFTRTWCERELAARGLETRIAQCSTSFYDVVIDLRRGSPTFHGHFAIVLSADCRKTMYIPKGLAHGFQTLEDDSEIFYQISQFYSAEHARGVRWDDPAFAIRWPDAVRTIADRDRRYPNVGRVEAALT